MNAPVYTNAYAGQVRRLIPDLIRARELLFDLVWKDIRVRYRYALMGLLWAVIEPLFMMLVLIFVFSFVLQMRYDETPPALFILTGLVAWQFLATALTGSARCLIDSENLVSKVNFPREILPMATVGTALVNFLIGAALLILLYLVMAGIPPTAALWTLPLFAIEAMLVMGLCFLISSLNVTFRDIAYITNAALLFGFYATPIFYRPDVDLMNALQKYDAQWLYPVYFVNPMAGLLTAYRTALLDGQPPALAMVVWPAVCSVTLLIVGLVVFRRRSGTLADQF